MLVLVNRCFSSTKVGNIGISGLYSVDRWKCFRLIYKYKQNQDYNLDAVIIMINTVTKSYNGRQYFLQLQELMKWLKCICSIRRRNTDYQAIQQWISEGNTVIDNGE